MCFRKRKKIDLLIEKVDKLAKVIETKELLKLRKEVDELSLVKDVKLKLKAARFFVDQETGDGVVKVIYEPVTITLKLDENGNVKDKDKMFYALNSLNISSIEDQLKIQKVLENAKKDLTK